jgi:protein-S-isoprenylcysteine O-methyltransferase Ste14
MAGLELKVPPPLVALACGILMKGIALWAAGDASAGTDPAAMPLPSSGPAADALGGWPLLRLAAIGLALAGLAIAGAGALSFRRARTTVNPLKPADTTALVTSGTFALTRNPMYLGMALLLAGWAAWLGTPWALAGMALFVAWITRFQIVPEERVLARLFGADFEAYRLRVRRWI